MYKLGVYSMAREWDLMGYQLTVVKLTSYAITAYRESLANFGQIVKLKLLKIKQ